jgi:hypothetical protein
VTKTSLKSRIAAAFAIGKDEIAAMADAIMNGFLASMKAAYHASTRALGLSSSQWAPSDEETATIEEWAAEQASAIAATYADNLDSASETFLDAYEGDIEAAAAAAGDVIGTWAMERADWKAEQISNYTCGSGDYSGIDAFVGDFEGEDVAPEDAAAFIDPVTGEPISPDKYVIACLPDSSTNDICATVAGQTFALDQWADLPIMPAHGNCPHQYLVIGVSYP